MAHNYNLVPKKKKKKEIVVMSPLSLYWYIPSWFTKMCLFTMNLEHIQLSLNIFQC